MADDVLKDFARRETERADRNGKYASAVEVRLIRLRRAVEVYLEQMGPCDRDPENDGGDICRDGECSYCNLEYALHEEGWEP